MMMRTTRANRHLPGQTRRAAPLRLVGFMACLAACWPPFSAGELLTFRGATLQPDPSNDGDSFRVNLGGRIQTVRLYYVDCPETSADSIADARRLREQTRYFGLPGAERTGAFGHEAAEFTARLLSEPFTVYTAFASAPGRSREGRVYAFVTTADGHDLAAQLVKHGLARSHGVGRATPGGLSRQETTLRFNDLEAAAMIRGAGIWSESDPERIVELRAQQRREEAELKIVQEEARGIRHLKDPLDVNHASVEELQLIRGIGPVLARRVVAGRPFESVDDLLRIQGIGPIILEAIRDQVKVGTPAAGQ